MFRFFKNNDWVYVVTDDRLPIFMESDKLIFAQSPVIESLNKDELLQFSGLQGNEGDR